MQNRKWPMTNGEFGSGTPTSGRRPCGGDDTSRIPEVVGHLRLALSRHVRQLHQSGLPVPREVEELAELLKDLAGIRSGAPVPPDQPDALTTRRPDPLLVTKAEAAERLGVSVRTLERLVATGRLPQVHVERLARLRVSDLEAYVRGLAQNEAPQSDRGPGDNPG
jgi:excisionase family DNA binding protein